MADTLELEVATPERELVRARLTDEVAIPELASFRAASGGGGCCGGSCGCGH